MDIGRTNKRVTFCAYEEKENELQQLEQQLVEKFTVWASIEPVRGKEYQEADKLRPELTHKVTCRYREDIRPDMIIRYKGRDFNISSILNVRENNSMLSITCVENIDLKRE